jgi:outer membrane protein OmpA-like peptidoglycan-associated protein
MRGCMSLNKLLLPGLGSVSALLLAATLTLSASAQDNSGTAQQGTQPTAQQGTAAQQGTSAQQDTSGSQNSAATSSASGQANTQGSTSATGKPLESQSKEGFWGHLNPMARKKWVNRQVTPVKDRLNELDQLTSKNASDIKDLDSRAQAGIKKAQDTADSATQQASAANTQAGQAQQLAQQASSRAEQLNQTVSNLDQYSSVTDTEIRFRPGQTVLNAKAKQALDQFAQQAQGQKGYIIEVEGYSRSRGQAGIANSQHMADAVVRYLVEQHKIPVFRIHEVAMGNAPVENAGANGNEAGNATAAKGTVAANRGSLVHVMLMHNSLAASNASAPAGGSGMGSTQQQ